VEKVKPISFRLKCILGSSYFLVSFWYMY